MDITKRKFGHTEIDITPIGLGVWQFSGGQGNVGSYWPSLESQIMDDIVKVSLEGGINWFDTAEVYGKGSSEKALAKALHDQNKRNGDIVIATKWWPAFRFASNISKTIDERLKCLDGFSIDLYQIHQPWSFSSVESEMDAMADLVKDGKIKAIGVSNFGANTMGRAFRHLEKKGIPLASNQVKYNLIDRKMEFNGILDTAKALGITIIAYSPLEQGLLTGKFHKNPAMLKKIAGPRKWIFFFRRGGLKISKPVIDAITEIGKNYEKTPAQIALNWLIHFHKDTVVAIPGATKIEQAHENVGAMTFSLTEEELMRLDKLTRRFWY